MEDNNKERPEVLELLLMQLKEQEKAKKAREYYFGKEDKNV
ncbi:hypothetical protein P4H42_06850 [Paenibacillus macerans]|nr:hypothetical protein [Paenibacillus macerans]MEC0329342.1 hypothetical protein [Paenibacillus macerans]